MTLHEFGHSFGDLCDEYSYGHGDYQYAYYDCVNCRPSCNEFSHLTSMCFPSCDARTDYFRPDDSIMLTLDILTFNEVSVEHSLRPRILRVIGSDAGTERHTLNAGQVGSGEGTIISSPAGIDCGSACSAEFDAGIEVVLEARAAAQSEFLGWAGNCSGTNTCSLVMDQARSVSARFDSSSGGIQDNRFFVEQQYRDFLGRKGDEGGIEFWVQELESGRVTRAGLVEDFFLSPEFQSGVAPVARLYFAYFNRIPDYAGLQFWVGELQGGRSLNDMSQAFAASPEFVATYGDLDDGEFVDLVYWNVLGRAPEPEGRAFWLSQLAAGMSRGAMMVEFSESAEYQALSFNEVQVTMMYVSMLRRAPDQAGFDYWVAELAAGRSILGLIDGFLASPEYLGRF